MGVGDELSLSALSSDELIRRFRRRLAGVLVCGACAACANALVKRSTNESINSVVVTAAGRVVAGGSNLAGVSGWDRRRGLVSTVAPPARAKAGRRWAVLT
jgi:hypothetical protein